METEWNNVKNEMTEMVRLSSASGQTRSSGMTFRGLQLSRFERQIITGNRCEAFLEMKCVFHGDSTDIFFDTEQYLRMDEVLKSGMTGLETVMNLCSSFLEAVRICGEYLLSPEDLSFQDDMIFCTGDFSMVKFMYIPGYRNGMSIRDKLADVIDTAIEYDEREENIVYFSEYKKRLYLEGKDLRTLTIITEEMIRKKRQEQIPMQPEGQGEAQERVKRVKGSPVKWSGPYVGKSDTAGQGEGSVLLNEESVRYEKSGRKKEHKSRTPGIGTKLKSFFTELVS